MSDQIDIHDEVTALLNAWCDRRMYKEICTLYGGYSCMNGLTDGWELFLQSLRRLRSNAFRGEFDLHPNEQERLDDLIRVVSKALSGR
jgi:hypothetical protein